MGMGRKRKTHKLEQSAFFRLPSLNKLRALLCITEGQLSRLIERDSCALYSEWDDLSKPAKPRHIEDPIPPLKRIQRRLAKLLARVEPPEFLYCPAKGRSSIGNAYIHRLGPVVHKIDIGSYFPSTTSKKVFAFFSRRLGCAKDIAGILTRLTTINGHLPTGAPSSPILAYYAHGEMWEEVNQLALSCGCTVSLYMDDLTISGDRVPGETVWKIKKLIVRNGLCYHKERIYNHGAKEVTGVILVDGTLQPPNRTLKKAHAVRREIKRGTGDTIHLVSMLKGYEGQSAQIAKSGVPVHGGAPNKKLSDSVTD